jgi:hypothetical protein
MAMKRKPSVWVAATAGIALVAGATVFLAVHSLSDADSWSSIGGFVTALITVVVSAVQWVARRPDGADESEPKRQRKARPGFRLAWIWGNGTVFYGDQQRNKVVQKHKGPDG